MIKLRKIGIVIALALIALATSMTAEAYVTADSFGNPLSSYAVTGYRFGENERGGIYHAGEDLQATAYTPVYAIANGKIVRSLKDVSGYGQVIVIEHTLPDNNKIASIYGHLSKNPSYPMIAQGTEVSKGTLIGYIGTQSENGGYAPHLHFGIRKGADDPNTWRYQGRVSLSELSNFNKPSEYLNLIRAVGANEVYRLANIGNKAWVSSADIFNSCGWGWDNIRPVTSGELSNHPIIYPSAVCFTGGTFIKRSDNPEISLIQSFQDTSTIQNRLRYPFGSWDAYLRYGGRSDLSNVRIVTNDEYLLHTQGKTLY